MTYNLVPLGEDNFGDLQNFFNDKFFVDRWSPFEMSMKQFSFPKVNISETEKEVCVTADIPGYSEDEITVEIHDGVLTLSGEHKQEEEEKGRKYYRFERSYGSFTRSFMLPAKVVEDEKSMVAEMENGVLMVTLPKVIDTPKKKVQVKKKEKSK